MNIIGTSVRRPVTVLVAVILGVIFGTLALLQTPVQLKPIIERPEISIEMDYPGAAPQEVEEQITDRLEEFLASAEGLREMSSESREGRSSINLEYEWGVDKDLAGIDVAKRLARVPDLPEETRDPTISTVSRDEERPVMYINVTYTKNDSEVDLVELTRIAENKIKKRLERVDGVGRVRIRGARRRELRVIIDPLKLAKLGLSVDDVANSIRRENRNTPGGAVESGRERAAVRTLGQFEEIEDVRETVVADRGGRRVLLRDIAHVQRAFEQPDSASRIDGRDAVSLPCYKKTGWNVLEVVGGLDEAMADLNKELRPKGIEVRKTYDESTYINNALHNVTLNLIFGALLAALVLIFFLRSISAVVTVGISIPIAIISSFILFYAFGRSINVISLAGITFAAGMVVDNAIIVFENIHRHRMAGKDAWNSVLDGGREVAGAVFASTLTTLAVFIPIVFVKEEAGQLFKDIAIAIALAVGTSMLVAFTVIPTLTARLFARRAHRPKPAGTWSDWIFLAPFGRAVASLVLSAHRLAQRNVLTRVATVLLLTGLALLSWTWLPGAEYLPPGNRPMIFSSVRFPPGTSLERAREVLIEAEDRLLGMEERRYFFAFVSPTRGFFGLALKWEYADQVDEIVTRVQAKLADIPQASIFMAKSNIFSRGIGSGKEMKVYITDPSLVRLTKTSNRLRARLEKDPAVTFVRSSFELGNPEVQVIPNRQAASGLGLTAADIGSLVETLVRGRRIGRYRGREFDEEVYLRLMGPEKYRQGSANLADVPIHTPSGKSVLLGSTATIDRGSGPTRIDHIERDRAITLDVKFGSEGSLEDIVARIENEIILPESAALPVGAGMRVAGSVDDLTRTKEALIGSFLLAIVITYLLMTALFESFIYPLIVMFSVPLATAGAVVGLKVVGAEFNVMTMLGWIILCGIVVNNAILIVDRTLRQVREGAPHLEAIEGAVQTRMRPIFMSMITTCLGMSPLIFSQGAGTELYRGLAASVFGGLMVSSVFTLILIPCLLSLVMGLRAKLASRYPTASHAVPAGAGSVEEVPLG